MSTTVSIICYKSKTLSNGEHPLMVCVSKDRKRKYKSLGISVKLEHWDFTKNKPKLNCPNKELINKIILDKELEYQKKVLELQSEDKEFTASTLIKPKVKQKLKTVHEFYNDLIEEMELAGRVGNSRVYKDSLRSLETYYKSKLDIPFSDIDIEFLLGYEKWLRQKDCKENSMNLYFRTLRSTYNKAIERKYAKKDTYPFDDFRACLNFIQQ